MCLSVCVCLKQFHILHTASFVGGWQDLHFLGVKAWEALGSGPLSVLDSWSQGSLR